MGPRTFLIEPTDLDVSGAQTYGELITLFDSRRPSMWDESLQEQVIDRLHELNFQPDIDFVIVAGSMVTVTICIGKIAATFGGLKLLCFDSRLRKYIASAIKGVA